MGASALRVRAQEGPAGSGLVGRIHRRRAVDSGRHRRGGPRRASLPARVSRAVESVSYAIDPPSPYDEPRVWWAFLGGLRKLDPNDPHVKDAKELAVEHLETLARESVGPGRRNAPPIRTNFNLELENWIRDGRALKYFKERDGDAILPIQDITAALPPPSEDGS